MIVRFRALVLVILLLPVIGQAREIALTFDDAPRGDGWHFSGEARTAALIRALEGAPPALFFVTTDNIDRHDARAERLSAYQAAGHRLANHSASHPWLHRIGVDAFLADIDAAQRRLERLGSPLSLVRYPYLDEGRSPEVRDGVRSGLLDRGLGNGYVTVDNYDWYINALAARAVAEGKTLDMALLGQFYVDTLMAAIHFYDAIAVEALGRSPRHVLLLHENDLAALFLPRLMEALKADGWSLVSAEQAYRDPIASEQPDTLFLGQGRVAALAHAAGLSAARDLIHPLEDEQALEAAFRERGIVQPDD